MPTIKPDESKEDWLVRCVPIVISEGTAKDGAQGTAICNSMWDEAKKKTENADQTHKLIIEVMSVGTWNNNKITLDHLKQMASNFVELKNVIKPMIKLGHVPDKGAPAYGWIEDLKVKGDKLIAYATNIPKLLIDAIRAKRYRRVSSEISPEYKHNGKLYGFVFRAIALLGAEIPAVDNLEDLQAFLTQNADLDSGVQCFVAPVDLNPDALPDIDVNIDKANAKKETFDMDKEIEIKFKQFSDRLDILTTENAQLKSDKAGLENTIKKFEQEKKEHDIQIINDKKDQSKKDFETYCENQVKAGSMLPAQRDILIDSNKIHFTDEGVLVFSSDQLKSVFDLSGKILEKKQKVQSDDPNKKKNFKDVQDEIEYEADKLMKENDRLTYTDAIHQVLEANQELAKRYIP